MNIVRLCMLLNIVCITASSLASEQFSDPLDACTALNAELRKEDPTTAVLQRICKAIAQLTYVENDTRRKDIGSFAGRNLFKPLKGAVSVSVRREIVVQPDKDNPSKKIIRDIATDLYFQPEDSAVRDGFIVSIPSDTYQPENSTWYGCHVGEQEKKQ